MSSERERKSQEDGDADETATTDISTCATQASNDTVNTENEDVFSRYKAKPSIFVEMDAKERRDEESQFLRPQNTSEERPPAEEEHEYLFKKRGVLYKFVEQQWESLGEGVAVVLEDEGRRRAVFSRLGVNIAALNFWVDFDLKPQATGRVIRFLAPEAKGGKAVLSLFAIRLRDACDAEALSVLLRDGAQEESAEN